MAVPDWDVTGLNAIKPFAADLHASVTQADELDAANKTKWNKNT
jgi:hypothetical protein